MINCKGCPFLYKDSYHNEYGCTRSYNIDVALYRDGYGGFNEPTSEDCKLSAVTYALKNERESIHFVPKGEEELKVLVDTNH